MKNNIIIKKINIVLSVLFLYSCIDQMQDAGDAKKVTPVRGTVTIQVNTGFVTKAGDPGFPTEGLRAVFNKRNCIYRQFNSWYLFCECFRESRL